MVDNGVILEGISLWEQIEASKSKPQQSEITESKQWSMVVIRDSLRRNDLSVFPPANHENLQISAQQNQREQKSSPKKTVVIPKELNEISLVSNQALTGWVDAAYRIWRAKINTIPTFLDAARGAFCSYYPVAGIASVVVVWWWFGARRRSQQGESVDHLKMIIKEKDEKIIQLLHQIAQMNELLVASRRSPESVCESIRRFFGRFSTKLLSS